ncbi:MAG: protein phosphatase CheZ [Betaproteobacteria bacterium]
MNSSTSTGGIGPEQAFERLGRITRQLHEAMSELGLERGLMEIANEIPDARDRLSHVGTMTESAATRVLNLVELSQPQCQAFKQQSQSMAAAIEPLRAHASTEEMGAVLASCQTYAGQAMQFADAQHSILGEIMMTQDFQDLSGQIIKKVIDVISLTEQQLLVLLMNIAPEHTVGGPLRTDLAGPQVPDKALKQSDVDDLLASFGF